MKRILRNLTALAAVLVVGTACQGDLTGPDTGMKPRATQLPAPPEEEGADQADDDSATTIKGQRLRSRYAMAAN